MGKEPLQQGNWRWNGREWVDVTRERARPPWALIGGVAAALVLVAAVFFTVAELRAHPQQPAGPVAGRTASPTPSARASASPSPSPVASAPTSASGVSSVAVALNGNCSTGGSCDLEVTVAFPVAAAAQDYAWTLQATDACTGAVAQLGDDHVTAQPGWNHVIGDRTVTLPSARGPLRITAVTTAPARATSPPLQVGSGSC